MRRTVCFLVGAYLLTAVGSSRVAAEDGMEYWPQWRGPLGNGVAPEGNPPVTWSEEKNVRWKTKCPGHGVASPIVWKDRVFVLSAIQTDRRAGPGDVPAAPAVQPARPRGMPAHGAAAAGHPVGRPGAGPPRPGGWAHPLVGSRPTVYYECVVLCLDRRTGKILWQRTAREEVPHEASHRDGSYASFTPLTDGEHVYAYFGSRGLHCYDFDGNLKWEKDLGKMRIKVQFGEGGSPAMHGNKILINFDHEGDSFLIAIDKQTGKTLWKTDRDEMTSWSTPLVVDVQGKSQVVVSATGRVRGYDVESGKLIWECGGQTGNVIPTPVAGFGMVFATSGFRGNALQAIELGHRDDLTGTGAVRWQLSRGTPYVPSPLLYGEQLYVLSGNSAILSCYQADTGAANFVQTRLNGLSGVYSSPVAAADRVYLIGREGKTQVIERSKGLQVLAVNSLDERFDASAAIAGNELFLRGRHYLYCIAEN